MGRLLDVLAEPGPGPPAAPRRRSRRRWPPGSSGRRAGLRDWEDAPGIAAQAAALGDRALLLADDDHRAFAHALGRSSTRADRDVALGKALRDAADVPLQIAEAAADVAALAALAAREGADAVRGDAWAAAALAEAASAAAAHLVE